MCLSWVQCLWRPGESDRTLGTEVTAASAGTWTQVLGRVEHAIDLPGISPAPSFFPLLFYETLQGPGIILMVGRLWCLTMHFCLWLKHNAVLGCHMFGIQGQYRIHLKLNWDFQVGIILVIYPNLVFKVNPFHNIYRNASVFYTVSLRIYSWYFICMSVLLTCMSPYHPCTWCFWRSEEGLRSPRTGVLNAVSLLVGAGN